MDALHGCDRAELREPLNIGLIEYLRVFDTETVVIHMRILAHGLLMHIGHHPVAPVADGARGNLPAVLQCVFRSGVNRFRRGCVEGRVPGSSSYSSNRAPPFFHLFYYVRDYVSG